MSSDFNSRRFDPSWLLREIGTDGAELLAELDAFSSSPRTEQSSDEALDRDIDELLEQIDMEGCRVCPLCGARVARGGSVLH
jgi:hypothetical protein